MKGWLARHGDFFVPADDYAVRVRNTMQDGEYLEFALVRPRSVPWHRLYFGICRTIGMNQDPQRDEDSIDAELRIRAGHFDVIFIDGHEVRVPKRIAFSKLNGEQWSELWPSLELAIRERFGAEYIEEAKAG